MRTMLSLGLLMLSLGGCGDAGGSPTPAGSAPTLQATATDLITFPRAGRLIATADRGCASIDVAGLEPTSLVAGKKLLLLVSQARTGATDQVGFFDAVTIGAGQPIEGGMRVDVTWSDPDDFRPGIDYGKGAFRYDVQSERVLVVPIVSVDGPLSLPADRETLREAVGEPRPQDPSIPRLPLEIRPHPWSAANPFQRKTTGPPNYPDFDNFGGGGVLVLEVIGKLSIGADCYINCSGAGFRGGPMAPEIASPNGPVVAGSGYRGEDMEFQTIGTGKAGDSAVRNGGGAGWSGLAELQHGGGGGGGGHAAKGGNGRPRSKGGFADGGNAIPDQPRLFLGAGGGGGGGSPKRTDVDPERDGMGGSGGGVLVIKARRIDVDAEGALNASGLDGVPGREATQGQNEAGATGAGGGGAGGTIWLVGPNGISVIDGAILLQGGAGSTSDQGAVYGKGSQGRLREPHQDVLAH